MLHVPLLRRSPPPAAPFGEDRPFTPASYIQLRRNARGLTIDQAAERIASKFEHLAQARALLGLLETPGVVARTPAALALLGRAIPHDPAVYAQLATEPAERHPQICRGCGCTQNDPCLGHEGRGPCRWAGPGICTRCTGGDIL